MFVIIRHLNYRNVCHCKRWSTRREMRRNLSWTLPWVSPKRHRIPPHRFPGSWHSRNRWRHNWVLRRVLKRWFLSMGWDRRWHLQVRDVLKSASTIHDFNDITHLRSFRQPVCPNRRYPTIPPCPRTRSTYLLLYSNFWPHPSFRLSHFAQSYASELTSL